MLWIPLCLAQGPTLPEGLDKEQTEGSFGAPGLPSGQHGTGEPSTPSPDLPSGLNKKGSLEQKKWPGKKGQRWHLFQDLAGYWEVRGGLRIHNDPVQDDVSVAEMRLQLAYEKYLAQFIPRGQLRATGDFIYDDVVDDHDMDMEKGEGYVDLREFWISFTPMDFLDVKTGRQILTWGTGNLVFLNDLFPKDYQSFFLGRHLDYLKAPSDALKVSLFHPIANFDLVYSPSFDADRFVDGTRLSFYDPAQAILRGKDMPLKTDRPNNWFDDHEIAIRIHGNIHAYELAAYGYYGFWKSPSGTNSDTGRRTFPELSAYGASIRGPFGPGIGNAEFSWYDSRQDREGDNAFVANSQLRFLVGYEQEIATDLTVGLQYYLEYMLDYGAYKENLRGDTTGREHDRHWITLDLTQELMAQNQLKLGLFIFYAPSTDDAYIRPTATYDFTDTWKFLLGGNLFIGDSDTFWGQFEKNSNVCGSVRYSF
jgi:hypothetical protein